MTIARRQRHHGQSISRWSLYQARRLRTRLRKASLASQGSLLQTWHRLRLAVLHSIWTASLMYKLAVQRQGSKALLDNYRPIALLNSDYKLLYECLATRFGPALQHVVDPTQTAFVPGRWIFFFFFIFFGRERYSLHEATITTSKKRDVHCIP